MQGDPLAGAEHLRVAAVGEGRRPAGGDPEARVSFQGFGRILAADEDYLWVSETDVAGTLNVARYRISEGG